jgi:hypothetical protein
MNERTAVRPHGTPSTPARTGLLQRKCACAGTPGPTGECAECRAKRLGIQRSAEGHPATAPPVVHDVLGSPGQPLDAQTRTFMEPRFGHDFSRVRIHADVRAAESARAVEARAYTVGSDIVFGSGQYAPHTAVGQRLLAHEITHVLQQREAATGSTLSPSLQPGPAGDAFEREAQAAESSITSSVHQVTPKLTGEKTRLRRQPEDIDSRRREPVAGQPGETLPYREAMETTEQGLYEEYQRDCAGVSVLERLERTELSPREKVQRFERRVRRLPDVIKAREGIKEQTDPSSRQAKLREFDETNIEPEFGKDYALGSLEDELARAQCQLSKARWEFIVFSRRGRIPGERRLLRR